MRTTPTRRDSRRRSLSFVRCVVWSIQIVASGVAFTVLAAVGVRDLRAVEPVAAVAIVASAYQSPDDSGGSTTSTPTIIVYLTRYGFEPQAISVPPGNYYLMVRNDSGRPDDIVVAHGVLPTTSTPQTSTLADPLPPGQPVDLPFSFAANRVVRQAVMLVPGLALIDDATLPGATCTITVAAP